MEKRMPLTRIFTLIFFAALLLAGTAQAASLYKWTDEQGNVHYSQSPPESQKADRIHVKDTPTAESNGQDTVADEGIPPSAEKDTEESKQRQKNCEIARYNLKTYKESDSIKQPDGKVIVISDEMRDAKMKEAQSLIDIYCK